MSGNSYNDTGPVVLRQAFVTYTVECLHATFWDFAVVLWGVPNRIEWDASFKEVNWQPTLARNRGLCTSGTELYLAFWGSDWSIWKALVRQK